MRNWISWRWPGAGLLVSAVVVAALDAVAASESLRLNHIQVVATHNSYHLPPPEPMFTYIRTIVPEAAAWDYAHAPLDVQLDRGVRSFELDLYYYPDGYRVFHVPHYDEESTCPKLHDCFRAVRAWSDANPGHIPIIFLMEFKVSEAELAPKELPPLDLAALEHLDRDIRAFFGDRLITPDAVRGDHETLEEAVLAGNWPTLEDALGKVLFVLHNRRELRDLYVADHTNLEGRAMFVESDPGRPDAATLIMNNPHDERIPERVKQGYLVRTRADSGLRTDPERRDQAFASGAHIVTTDFPAGQAEEDTGYVVKLPDRRPARCNPVNAPAHCDDAASVFSGG